MSPIPKKPCIGDFSLEDQCALEKDQNRDRWNDHLCQLCGLMVSARIDKGKWVPELHWPSVHLVTRKRGPRLKTGEGQHPRYSRLDGSAMTSKKVPDVDQR